MSIEFFKERVELLTAEHKKAVETTAMLTEQLEKSKSHVSMVMGHMNEAMYQLQEFSKREEAKNGEANKQEAEKPAKK